MVTTDKPGVSEITFRKAVPEDAGKLCEYFDGLSLETKHRFGPHSFDFETLDKLLNDTTAHILYVATDKSTTEIIGYCVVRKGYLEHDSPRLSSFGLTLDHQTDCTLAPSLADRFQHLGIGRSFHQYVSEDLKAQSYKRIILWGGVQASNHYAVRFYERLGYQHIGEFEYYGMNFDMVLNL